MTEPPPTWMLPVLLQLTVPSLPTASVLLFRCLALVQLSFIPASALTVVVPVPLIVPPSQVEVPVTTKLSVPAKIGRASCRERVEVGAPPLKLDEQPEMVEWLIV